ncbi:MULTISPECIES: sigma 54-interacting transcriptional regulator [unclassified Pseudodesulfovibrio]|uniref:sigma-54 interaction domain-containing protein n=1 Tax=unclassified Pseudodesulfovibrio TaxID=2661612 RepID=UPI000FEC03EA|nr:MULTISPECIES: sigma 54-interacting transcriptional regulator [unclassified Pseudodesulfovibrio]MCJ2164724.1 sigma 54-interacting transcriptional regulator [Pseudodesulfovibrio sp. S3-i]RWU04087.1 PAS domain S-box protein [Pseudodesulfovibrio sp. S3]
MTKTEHFGLDFETFARLIDNLHDEVIIYDNNYHMLYVNKACERHYGFTQEQMVGLPFWEVVRKHAAWNRPALPAVYEHKRPIKQEQKTYLGLDVLTIANPIFDDNGEIEYVVLNVRDSLHKVQIPSLDEVELSLEMAEEPHPEDLIYHSTAMENVVQSARKVASLTAPCLLLGESGCGKSLLAKFIHANSIRKDKPFVVVNCAAIPDQLFESELFGHVKGAFSGATNARGGLFAKAKGGTLFLDEISELPFPMQAKLLHAVQEMEYRPVGSSQTVTADVRILAASNRNLERMAADGTFRQDLFFRLNVFDITIPPLRDRREDLVPLIFYFFNHYGKKYGSSKRLSPEAQSLLCQHSWPGNVRELAHLVERLMVTTEGDTITIDNLPTTLYQTTPSLPEGIGHTTLDAVLESMERKLILDAIAMHGSSRKIASAMGISQSRASRLIRKHTGKTES